MTRNLVTESNAASLGRKQKGHIHDLIIGNLNKTILTHTPQAFRKMSSNSGPNWHGFPHSMQRQPWPWLTMLTCLTETSRPIAKKICANNSALATLRCFPRLHQNATVKAPPVCVAMPVRTCLQSQANDCSFWSRRCWTPKDLPSQSVRLSLKSSRTSICMSQPSGQQHTFLS